MIPTLAQKLRAPSIRSLIADGWDTTTPSSPHLDPPQIPGAPGLAFETGDTTNLSSPTLARPQMLRAPSIRSFIADGWDTTTPRSPRRATTEAAQ